MGRVYLAQDLRRRSALVAIKECTRSTEDAAGRLLSEVSFLERLSHPSLPRLVDRFVEPDGRPYLVMTFVSGQNLGMLRIQRTVSEREAVRWACELCEVLSYLHAWVDPLTGILRPIVHQDVKPANLILPPLGQSLVLVDLGLASFAHQPPGGATKGYSPPEQLRNTSLVDARTDIFAAGSTLLFLLTGQDPPDPGRNNWRGERELAIQRATPNRELQWIVRTATEYQPDKRFSTARSLLVALQEFAAVYQE